MKISVRAYEEKDLPEMIRIWNEVVEDGVAFPQEELLNAETGKEFFAGQTYSAVAEDTETGKVYGLYILHPNNVGRCGHICNASYAVSRDSRGLHIGEKLVSDCLVQGKAHGYGVLQFNAVVAGNIHARHLYERLGFVQLGVIPKGFRGSGFHGGGTDAAGGICVGVVSGEAVAAEEGVPCLRNFWCATVRPPWRG